VNDRYPDREHAGRVLAERLQHYADRPDVVVMALPRGGVPVAYEVATALGAPLDVLCVRKLGVPGHEELAMGAIATGGVVILNDMAELVPREDIKQIVTRELAELERRESAYRQGPAVHDIMGTTLIVVDDGLATGATMRAAIRAARTLGAARVVVAVPIAAPDVCEALEWEADEVVCARTVEPLHAVGLWYEDFSQTTDDQVRELLTAACRRQRSEPEARR
jgi:putative phosphoribosyl transferase